MYRKNGYGWLINLKKRSEFTLKKESRLFFVEYDIHRFVKSAQKKNFNAFDIILISQYNSNQHVKSYYPKDRLDSSKLTAIA